MHSELESVLESARRNLEEPLAAARAELRALDERRQYLQEVIARAEALSGAAPPTAGRQMPRAPIHLTLHEALALVLREERNRWMTARELADAVNERRLYTKKDGTAVEVNQVHARTKNYDAMFEKMGARIRLRDAGGSADAR